MDFSKKQQQLDTKKWVDSELKGTDTCGEYKYCAYCNKDEAFPCAYAYEKFSAISKLAKEAKTTTKKTTASKTTAKTTTKKTTTAKKPSTSTAKKTTTRKTTNTPVAA